MLYAQTPTGPAAGPLPYNDEGIITIKEYKPQIAIEPGKDSYMGRIGITGAWCKNIYFGINLRMFPYRNRRN